MKTKILFTSVIFMAALMFCNCQTTFHSFSAKKINGATISFSSFAGKKLLVVNTASYCVYTSQYADLQSLYNQYKGSNFEIIGFPANNFASQEPHNDSTINAFCTNNYGITFTMMSKISVSGSDIHPVYDWLTKKSKNGVQDAPVNWNFQKFLIDENGKWVAVHQSAISPLSSAITNWIKTSSGVEENDLQKRFLIYPNPFGSSVTFGAEGMDEPWDIVIYDAVGKQIIKEANISRPEWSYTNLAGAAGYYHYVISTESGKRAGGKLISVE